MIHALLLAGSLFLTAAPTAPAPAQPEASARKQAEAHYRVGKAFFYQKQFARAAEEYRAAHALMPDPAFLYNIGLALEKGGQLEEALSYYRRYIEADPSGLAADEVSERVAVLTGEVEALKAERERERERERQREEEERARALATEQERERLRAKPR